MTVTLDDFLNADLSFENERLYKEKWLPKIEAYRAELAKNTPSEYKIDDSLIPQDIDTANFNAVKFLYDKKLLTSREFEITDTSATELVRKLSKGELTAVETLKAFAKRAVIAQQFTKCAMQIFIDEGLARAEELDNILAKTGKPVGPLHGLPISLKEHIGYEGKVTHSSYVSLLDNINHDLNPNTRILSDAGAVFYIRTTQPQTVMHIDSYNNITGRTRNPYNTSLSPGGSSSGEGALVSFGGSPLGIGSDIGGSIRCPSAFSGNHGFRCSTRRTSNIGGVSAGDGFDSIISVVGPMARKVEDIQLFMETYINFGKPWNYDVWSLPLPWRKVASPKVSNLVISVVYDDGIVKPLPAIERGLKYTVDVLKKHGAKIIELKPMRSQLAIETVNKLYNGDGILKQKELLSASGEPLPPLTKWALNVGNSTSEFKESEIRKLNVIRDSLRNEYNKYMIDNKVDFILTAANHNVAAVPNKVYNWSYTSLYNLLDMPGLVFQTGLFSEPELDKLNDVSKPRSDIEDLEYSTYDSRNFADAPIALQLVGRRYFDEEVLAAGKVIVELLESLTAK